MAGDLFLESLSYQATGDHRRKHSALGPAPKTPAERRDEIRLGGSMDNETYNNGPDDDGPDLSALQRAAHGQPVRRKAPAAGIRQELEEIREELTGLLGRLDEVMGRI